MAEKKESTWTVYFHEHNSVRLKAAFVAWGDHFVRFEDIEGADVAIFPKESLRGAYLEEKEVKSGGSSTPFIA